MRRTSTSRGAVLRRACAASLLAVDDSDDDRTAWFGPDLLCSEWPADGLILGRLVDVAVSTALLTDAEVHIVAPDLLGSDRCSASHSGTATLAPSLA